MMGSLKSKSYSYFLKKIPDYGLANRTEEQNKKHFSRIWLEAINTIFEVASDEEEMQELKKITSSIIDSMSILLDKKLDLFSSTVNNK